MDPHCGWCFGYRETITEFYDSAVKNSSIGFEVVTGGLFIPARPGSLVFANEKRPIAERVQRQFGVEFSATYFENVLSAPCVDSTPGSKAICASNSLDNSKSLYLANAIIEAAFIDGRNISLPEVVLEIAKEQDFESESFSDTMDSQKIADDLSSNLDFAAQVGTGFPTVLIHDKNRNKLVNLGGSNLSVADLGKAIDDYL